MDNQTMKRIMRVVMNPTRNPVNNVNIGKLRRTTIFPRTLVRTLLQEYSTVLTLFWSLHDESYSDNQKTLEYEDDIWWDIMIHDH